MLDDVTTVFGEQWELVNHGPMPGETENVTVFKLSLGSYKGDLYTIFIPGYGYNVIHAPRYNPPVIMETTSRRSSR